MDKEKEKSTGPDYRALFDVHKKFIDLTLAQSGLSHGYLKAIKDSGDVVEDAVRKILRVFLPDRFAIVSGYVVSATDRKVEPKVSKQLDIIIVDTMVPHRLFQLDSGSKYNVVPIEAVIAVFEVKKTLDSRTLKEAQKHLEHLKKELGMTKTNASRFLPGGVPLGDGIQGGSYSNPLFGVLALSHDKDVEKGAADDETPEVIFSFDGYLSLPRIKDDNSGMKALDYIHYRAVDGPIESFVSLAYPSFTKEHLLAIAFGYIATYSQNSSGRNISFDSYFLNTSLNIKTSSIPAPVIPSP